MATMINSYSIGVSLNTKGVTEGSKLARGDLLSLNRVITQSLTPMEQLAKKMDLVERGLQVQKNLANQDAAAIERLTVTKERLQSQMQTITAAQEKENAATQRAIALQNQAAAAEARRAKAMKDRDQGLARQAWLQNIDQQQQQGQAALQARLAAFKEQKRKEAKIEIDARQQTVQQLRTQARVNSMEFGPGGVMTFGGIPASGAGSRGGSVGGGFSNQGMGLLMLSQTIDDVQYGIRGIVNNVAPMIMAFGGSAGLAGAATIALVGINQIVQATDRAKDGAGGLAASTRALNEAFAPLGKAASGIGESLEWGLGLLLTAATDVVTLNAGFEATNKLLDSYNAKLQDERTKKALEGYVAPFDKAAYHAALLTAEYEKQRNLVTELAKLQQDSVAESNRFQGDVNRRMDAGRESLLAGRVGGTEASLIMMAREAAMNNVRLGNVNNPEAVRDLQDKFLGGQITSYKEYNALLTQEQQLQMQSVAAIEKKAEAEEKRKKDAEKQQQELEKQAEERRRLVEQAEKERASVDKMFALQKRLAELQRLSGTGVIDTASMQRLRSQAMQGFLQDRLAPVSVTAADLGSQEAYKILTGQQNNRDERQLQKMEEQRLEQHLSRVALEKIDQRLAGGTPIVPARK